MPLSTRRPGFSVEVGLQTLVDRCLITMEEMADPERVLSSVLMLHATPPPLVLSTSTLLHAVHAGAHAHAAAHACHVAKHPARVTVSVQNLFVAWWDVPRWLADACELDFPGPTPARACRHPAHPRCRKDGWQRRACHCMRSKCMTSCASWAGPWSALHQRTGSARQLPAGGAYGTSRMRQVCGSASGPAQPSVTTKEQAADASRVHASSKQAVI